MTYASERTCWDADSHVMEDAEFLSRHAETRHREALRIGGGKSGGELLEKHFSQVESKVAERMADAEKTKALEEDVIGARMKGWFAHGAMHRGERSRTLDLLGFQGQLVFSTFAGGHLFARDPELMYAATRAHSRAMADFCDNDPRLMPVAMIPLADAARAIEELEAAVELGCRAIQVPSDAPGGNTKGFSPAHADLDGFWARLEETGLPLMLHIGGGKLLPKAYHRNGRPQTTDWLGGGENLRAKDLPAIHHSPENFLTSMILDGLFDRHPTLRCGVIEQGASWVPSLLRHLDHALVFAKTEPIVQALELKPSEYLRRQVKFTPFVFEDVGWLIEQCGEEMLLFSSDYPHPEGGRDPIGKFEASLDAAGVGATARRRFYASNFEEMMGIG